MRPHALIAVLLLVLPASAETLRELLDANSIPQTSFTAAELDQEINGNAARKDPYTVIAYMRLKGEVLTGYPSLVRYDSSTGAVLHAEIKPDDPKTCCGSPGDITIVGDFVTVSFDISPSAVATLVIGKDLKLVTTIYGFGIEPIAPAQVVFIENMVHFAAVHPERLAFLDLATGRKAELYPPKGDLLRTAFAHEHAKGIPSAATCAAMNDPCRPELYDETIVVLGGDGAGAFALAVSRAAVHAAKEGQPGQTVAAEDALYVYAPSGDKWNYCEQKLTPAEAQSLAQSRIESNPDIRQRCTPNFPVEPDRSNADFSPLR